MSNNFDKIVKLACKPKNAPPKAKYVDALVAATYSDDGSLNDINRSLSLRLREPNAVVVFKALLTLHQMIRSGSSEQLLENLAQTDVLRLKNVSSANWEGYSPPSSLGQYANYLDTRIRSWRECKHDLVRVQTESNRRSDGLAAGSKARRLRHLPVDKGLLREVKGVQKILDSLVLCRFYDDDLKDENTVLAFRMLVKDLLVLFQAGNEGVCNILEHYFEMSKVDASDSFDIYKSFIKQTDRVVDYLGVARKLHNVVNVPVPNLKHAPTGLVKALEEYLNDPNFENNRLEYKKSLGVVEGKAGARTPSPNPPAASEPSKTAPSSSSASSAPAPASAPAPTSVTSSAPPPSQKIQDFFDSIQADQQPTMFGGPAQPFTTQMQQQMQPAFNPFRQSTMMPQGGFMQPQMTGFPGSQQAMPSMQPQQTGAMAFGGAQAFGQQQQPFSSPQQPFQPQQSAFVQPQQTGFIQPQPQQPQQTGFLQSQTTGANPFRQSMMLNTNVASPSGTMSQPTSPFPGQSQIQRPGSVPPGAVQSLSAQPTGTKNPFAPAGGVPQPKKQEIKGPSMYELAMGKVQGQVTGADMASPWGSMNGSDGAGANSAGGMADIASAFTFDQNQKPTQSKSDDFLSQFGSLSTSSPASKNQFNSLPSLSTGSSSPFNPTPSSPATLSPQRTGFGGSTVKRFQPTSSFGSQLLEGLPSIAEPAGGGAPEVQSQSTGFPAFGQTQQSTGQTQSLVSFGTGQNQNQAPATAFGGSNGFGVGGGGGQGVQPQSTGTPNPFRQSTMFTGSTGSPSPFANAFSTGNGNAFGQQGTGNAFGQQQGGNGAFGQQNTGMPGGGAFGASSPFAGQSKPFGQGQGQGQGGMFGAGQQGGSLI